jgi:hypothetical protein
MDDGTVHGWRNPLAEEFTHSTSNIWTPLAKWNKIKQQGKSVTALRTLPIINKKKHTSSVVTSIREGGDIWKYDY